MFRGDSTNSTTMALSRSAALLISTLTSCAVKEVWGFLPASLTLTRCPTINNPAQGVNTATRPAAAEPSYVVCLSSASPFEGVEHDNSEDDVDVVQRQAEQLEEMIRGSRGIVVEAIEREWREEMLRVLSDEGERLCLESYEGYLDRGRGAIFVSLVTENRIFWIVLFRPVVLDRNIMVARFVCVRRLRTGLQHARRARPVNLVYWQWPWQRPCTRCAQRLDAVDICVSL